MNSFSSNFLISYGGLGLAVKDGYFHYVDLHLDIYLEESSGKSSVRFWSSFLMRPLFIASASEVSTDSSIFLIFGSGSV